MAQEGWSLDQEEAPCSATPTAAPSLCLNNCGFFGSAATMNLCSSCYKTLVLLKPSAQGSTAVELEEEPKVQPASRVPALSPPLEPPSSSSASAFSSVLAEAATATAPVGEVSVYGEKGQKPLRCFACRKKVGLRGFNCRCGDVFCALHRYSDKHSCSFDYKAAGRVSIEKANPVVKADKLHRI